MWFVSVANSDISQFEMSLFDLIIKRVNKHSQYKAYYIEKYLKLENLPYSTMYCTMKDKLKVAKVNNKCIRDTCIVCGKVKDLYVR